MAALSTLTKSAGVLVFLAEVNKAMRMLAEDKRTIFLGQSVCYDGAAIYGSLDGVPQEKRLEMPVLEDFQLGFSIGLSLIGKIPVCIYPRLDFLMLGMNQLVNHLDRFREMGDFNPKVIVRARVGQKTPLDAGPQHTGSYAEALRLMLRNIKVVELNHAEFVMTAYWRALESSSSTLVIENPNG